MDIARNTGYVVLLVGLLFFVSASSAASLELLPVHADAEACICDTELIVFNATNTGSESDSFDFSVTGDAPWGVVAPESAIIGPAQTLPVYTYLTPSCFSSTGTYRFTVKGKSSTHSKQSTVTLLVTPCVSIQDPTPTKKMCFGESKVYRLILRNKSRTADKNYTILLSGSAAPAVTAPTQVFVASQGESSFEIEFDSTKLSIGEFKLSLRAVSIYPVTGQPTEDQATIDIGFTVEDCQQIELRLPTVKQGKLDKCIELSKPVPVEVYNHGALADTVTLKSSSPDLVLGKTRVELAPGENATIQGLLKSEAGNQSITVTATSALGAGAQETFDVTEVKCYGVEIDAEIPETDCSDWELRYPVTLTNTGDADDFVVFVKDMDFAVVNPEKVHLKAGEHKTVHLMIASGLKDANYTPRIVVESGFTHSEKVFEVELVRCYAVRLVATNYHVCQCEDKAFPMDVVNDGTKNDSYNVQKFEGPDWLEFDNMTGLFVYGKSKRTLMPVVFTCDADPTIYEAVFSVVSLSRNVSDKVCVNVTVHSKDECYPALIEAPESKAVECASSVIPFNITNIGLIKNTYSLRVEGPKWAMINPDYVTLERGERKEMYLVVSPPLNEAGNEHEITITAVSRGVTSSKTIRLKVVPIGALKEEEELQSLSADVSFEDGVLQIDTVPEAVVLLLSPSKNTTQLKTDANGSLSFAVQEAGEWKITILKQGFESLMLEYDVSPEGISLKTGLFTGLLQPQNLLSFAVFVAVILIAVAAYYKFGDSGKQRK